MGGSIKAGESLPPEEKIYIRIHGQYVKWPNFGNGFRPVMGGLSGDLASMCRPCETRARIPPERKSRPEEYGVVTVTAAYVESIPGLKAIFWPLPENPAHVDIRDDLNDEVYLGMVRLKLEAGVLGWEYKPGDPQPTA